MKNLLRGKPFLHRLCVPGQLLLASLNSPSLLLTSTIIWWFFFFSEREQSRKDWSDGYTLLPDHTGRSVAALPAASDILNYSVYFYFSIVLYLPFYAPLCIARHRSTFSSYQWTVNFVGSCDVTLFAIAFLCCAGIHFYSASILLVTYLRQILGLPWIILI